MSDISKDDINEDLFKAQVELGRAKASLDSDDLENVFQCVLSAINYLKKVKISLIELNELDKEDW